MWLLPWPVLLQRGLGETGSTQAPGGTAGPRCALQVPRARAVSAERSRQGQRATGQTHEALSLSRDPLPSRPAQGDVPMPACTHCAYLHLSVHCVPT